MLLESGCIVLSSSPYGAPVLFAEKKGRGGLKMCTDYRSLNAGCMLGKMSCPVCKSVLMETSTEALGYHSCPHCSHRWNGPKVIANPLAALWPYLLLAGVLCFESQRPWEVVSAAKFARLSR